MIVLDSLRFNYILLATQSFTTCVADLASSSNVLATAHSGSGGGDAITKANFAQGTKVQCKGKVLKLSRGGVEAWLIG